MTIRRYRVTPTVTAGAYSANDVVGGLLTFTGLKQGTLQSITICDKASQTGEYDVVFFDSEPTGINNNDTFDIADADLEKIIYFDSFPDAAATRQVFNDNSFSFLWNLDVPLWTTGGSLYAFLIAKGTPTYAGTSDITVTLQVETDNKRAGLSS